MGRNRPCVRCDPPSELAFSRGLHGCGRWRDLVLDRLASLLHADRALFALALPGVDPAYRLLGADERDLEPYLTYYRHVDPFDGVAAAMEDGILSGTRLIPWVPGGIAGYVRSEVYNDYYKPLGSKITSPSAWNRRWIRGTA